MAKKKKTPAKKRNTLLRKAAPKAKRPKPKNPVKPLGSGLARMAGNAIRGRSARIDAAVNGSQKSKPKKSGRGR